MINDIPEMIDAVFDVSGDTLPAAYPFALWQSLAHHAPALETDLSVGVIPLRVTASEEGMLLPKRAKLGLRLPLTLATHTAHLAGRYLDIGDIPLQLGQRKLRPIHAHSTLHAHLVNSSEDEVQFLENVATQLDALGVTGKLICGMRNSLVAHNREIVGYSLVIHDLKPESSLRLQYAGLGTDRRFGCGIFVPYKGISDLD